jgi:hypothetical protein
MGDASEQVAVVVQVPIHHVGSLKELLRAFPAIQYVASGWLFQKIAIIGPPEDMAAFRPRLRAWEHECVSRDAW